MVINDKESEAQHISLNPTLADQEDKTEEDPKMTIEESSEGKVKGFLLWNYLTSGVSSFVAMFLFSLFGLVQVLATVTDWWVSYWTEAEESRSNLTQALGTFEDTEFKIVQLQSNQTSESQLEGAVWYASIYGGMMGALVVMLLARTTLFAQVLLKASQLLHDEMFNGVVAVSRL